MTRQNGANFEIVETTEYLPFGGTREHTGTDVSDYKFTDQELDKSSNLYNYDARLYDPIIGRFVIADSIVPNWYNPQSLNRYSYCRNNPLIFIDPSGHGEKLYFFDQKKNPNNKRRYTASVYVVDENGKIHGPYRGSTFPNDPNTHNTLNEGKHDFNNAIGHKGEKGLNIVKDKDKTTWSNRVVPGTKPDGKATIMTVVDVHSGVKKEDDPANLNRDNRGSEGCPTINPEDFEAFSENFDWSGNNNTTGDSKGEIEINRGDNFQMELSLMITQQIQRITGK